MTNINLSARLYLEKHRRARHTAAGPAAFIIDRPWEDGGFMETFCSGCEEKADVAGSPWPDCPADFDPRCPGCARKGLARAIDLALAQAASDIDGLFEDWGCLGESWADSGWGDLR